MPTAPMQCTTQVALRTTPRQCGNVPRVPLPTAPEKCAAGVPLPTTPRQCSSAPEEFHRPLPLGTAVGCRRSSTAHCAEPTTRVPLPTAPRQCGTKPQEFHDPMPLGTAAVYNRSSIAHYPQAVCHKSSTTHCP